MATTFAVARALHILFAILWAGGALYAARVQLPLIKDAAYALRFYGRGRHDAWMGVTATGTVAFGGLVLLLNRDGYGSETIGMGGAMLMGLGMTAAMVAYGIGVLGHVPNNRRLRTAASKVQDSASLQDSEFQDLVAKDARLAVVSAILVAAALLCMVTFRLFA